MQLYHLSKQNLNGQTLVPRVPESNLGEGFEDTTTPRVCFASSISGAIRAINCLGRYANYYVHVIDQEIDDSQMVKCTEEMVSDSIGTNEYWVLCPVKVKCIAKINVGFDDSKNCYKKHYYSDGCSYIMKYPVHFKYIERYDNKLLDAINKGISEAFNFNIEDSNDDFNIKKYKPLINEEKQLRKLFKWKEYEACARYSKSAGIKYKVQTKEELKSILKDFNNDQYAGFDLNWLDVSEITDMEGLLMFMYRFNCDISEWDVSNVTNMCQMFYWCQNFNQPIGNWNVSNVTNMSTMFACCEKFNQDISKWDVSKVETMCNMFYSCNNFNQPLNDWDITNVKSMFQMFGECSVFNQPLDKWDVSNVENMSDMFKGCLKFNQNISNWNLQDKVREQRLFYKTYAMKYSNKPSRAVNESIDINDIDSIFNIKKTKLHTKPKFDQLYKSYILNKEFEKCVDLWISQDKQIGYKPYNIDELKEIVQNFDDEKYDDFNLNWLDVSDITDMSYLFYEMENFNCNISCWDVSNVENMEYMFYECKKFNNSLHCWDVSKVKDMTFMFSCCFAFDKPLNTWNVSNVEDMYGIFNGCTQFNQDLDKWDVSKVKDMTKTFAYCFNFNGNITTWDVSKVSSMSAMFVQAKKFNQPIGKWNTKNVKNMSSMFEKAYEFNQYIGDWNVYKVKDVEEMFYEALSFNQDLSHWKFIGLESDADVFYKAPIKNQYKPMRLR